MNEPSKDLARIEKIKDKEQLNREDSMVHFVAQLVKCWGFSGDLQSPFWELSKSLPDLQTG